MRGNQSRRKLFVENLESRLLLTADHGGGHNMPTLDAGVLTLSGSGKNDQIVVSVDTQLTVSFNKQTFQYNTADVTEIHIDGGGGNDSIWVDDTVLVAATIDGGNGNDRIHGGGGDDTILGGRGNDRINGGGGIDTINGDAGNDWVWGDDGDDVVHGDAGNDHVFGGAGNDQLFGDAGHDAVSGDDGDDVLHGGLGHDHVFGGAGNDQLFGDENKDLLWGGDGDDQLFGGGDNDHLWGDWGNDLLKGEAGSDHLDGGAGDNLLDGDTGRNHYKNGFVVDLDLQLVAPLTRSDTLADAGEARLTQVVVGGAVQVQFQVSVFGAAAGETLNVSVDGVLIGTLTTDATPGAGSATFDPSALAVTIDEGSLIEIGPDSNLVVISGTLVKVFA